MKKYIAFSLLSVLLFSTCDEDFFDQVVDVEIPEHTPALAITSNLSNTETIISVYVTSSIGILEPNNPPPIEDAKVELYKNGALFQALPHIDDGFYGWEIDEPLLNDRAEYELKVEKDGFESVSSVQQMPKQIDIISASYEEDGTVSSDGERVDEFKIEFQDEAGVANYYQVRAVIEYTTNNGETYESSIDLDSNDPSFQYTNNGTYISDILFDGDQHELLLYTDYFYYDENSPDEARIKIQLIHVTKAKYFREISVYNYDPENPFSEPTIIFSNIENGYGIFSMVVTGPAFYIDL